jgi:hypothetical protein
MPTTL